MVQKTIIRSFLKNLEKYTILGEKASRKADQSTPLSPSSFFNKKSRRTAATPKKTGTRRAVVSFIPRK